MMCQSTVGTMLPELSFEQQFVADAIIDWRARWPDSKQTLALGGLAGTGKSTLVSFLSQVLPRPQVLCPTGKAANVLQGKNVDAKTIHSYIYEPRTIKKQTHFRLKRFIDAETLIVDEASMVNSKLYADLRTFSVPVLFVGDHGQLEPVGDNANLMADPELRLEEIHRQAKDNPIIRLAAAFREGRESQVWSAMNGGTFQDPSGNCIVTTRRRLDEFLFSGMQVIVGFNALRHELNSKIRTKLGFGGAPSPGEKLICLRNNSKFNICNGQEFEVQGVYGERPGIIELELETDNGRRFAAPCLATQFGNDAVKEHRDAGVLLMDFGYVLTVHKAQGSAWPGVLIYEQIASNWDARRWRYTATTRAINRVVYCGD